MPVYALVVARRDGKLGPGLHESAVDCAANAARPAGAAAQDPAQQDPNKRCLIVPLFNFGRFQMRGLHMENVASALNNVVDRNIIDKTGLTGPYEFDLSWTPDSLQPTTARPTPAAAQAAIVTLSSGDEHVGIDIQARTVRAVRVGGTLIAGGSRNHGPICHRQGARTSVKNARPRRQVRRRRQSPQPYSTSPERKKTTGKKKRSSSPQQ